MLTSGKALSPIGDNAFSVFQGNLNMTDFDIILKLSIIFLNGNIICIDDVSAGNGSIIDWRTFKSGEIVDENLDPFDSAFMFFCIVGASSSCDIINKLMY